MKLRYPLLIQLILLCLLVVLVYEPALQAEPCLLDDVAMLKGLQVGSPLDLKSLLPSDLGHLIYHRPMIGVSYWLSQTLWNAAPYAMHIENLVFHVLNVILLFWLIKLSLTGKDEKLNRYLPFLGALLFAAHPIATESVNWISGRTDLIMGSCLLGASIALVLWQRKRSNWWLLLLTLLLLAGAIMTKEVAWGFLVVLPFFLTAPHDSRTYSLLELYKKFSRIERLLFLTAIALCFFLAAVSLSFWPTIVLSSVLGLIVLYRKPRLQPLPKKIFIGLTCLLISGFALIPYLGKLARQSASGDFYSTFSRTILIIGIDPDNTMTLFSAAIAFYIKKFFLPLPLSFAITDIAPGYLFAGIAIILLTAFLCAWRSRAAIFFLTGITLLLPALPLVHGEIAWAPYAERYVYVSSSFWIASIAVGLGTIKLPAIRPSGIAICVVLIPMAAFITFKRSLVWQNNVSLFEDTVRKSPDHFLARVLFMSALGHAGRLPEALEQYQRVQSTPGSGAPVKYVNVLAVLLHGSGQTRSAYEVLETALAKQLPGGRRHPLNNEEWQKLYELHKKLKQELP